LEASGPPADSGEGSAPGPAENATTETAPSSAPAVAQRAANPQNADTKSSAPANAAGKDAAASSSAGPHHTAALRTAAPPGGECLPLNDPEVLPCRPDTLVVNSHTLQLERCEVLGLHAVFDPPTVRCPAGSQLDFQGECRDELFQKFRSGFYVTGTQVRSLCPTGWVQRRDGRCVEESTGGLG